jgi:hypothetical protein
MKIRINDFGAVPPTYIGDPPENASRKLAVIQYQPCSYYGRLEEFLSDGWEDCGTWITQQNHTISKSFFDLKETTIVIADIEYDEGRGSTTLTSVGERLLRLTPEERLNFFEVYEIASKKLIEQHTPEQDA